MKMFKYKASTLLSIAMFGNGLFEGCPKKFQLAHTILAV